MKVCDCGPNGGCNIRGVKCVGGLAGATVINGDPLKIFINPPDSNNPPLHIKNERVIWVDVDDTLIVHGVHKSLKMTEVADDVNKGIIMVYRHEQNIRLVKEEFSRGSYVIVHSKGGHQWAADVVEALGLSPYVNQILTKPTAYIDDKPVSEWLTDRIFIPHTQSYKD